MKITRLYMKVTGKCQSTSSSLEYMTAQLKCADTELSPIYNFKSSGSTSVSTQTIEATVLPTADQLDDLCIECSIGSYGGNINGATVYLEYAEPTGNVSYYGYTYSVNGNATIATIIGVVVGDTIFRKINGSWVQASKEYVKVSGTWKEVSKVYKKVSGSWVEQSDISAMFDENAIYVQG